MRTVHRKQRELFYHEGGLKTEIKELVFNPQLKGALSPFIYTKWKNLSHVSNVHKED
jgi:hypothetical protein